MTIKNLTYIRYLPWKYIIERPSTVTNGIWAYSNALTGKVWNGVDNNGFRKLISEGKNATNAYTFTKYYKQVDHYKAKFVRYNNGYDAQGWRRDTYMPVPALSWGSGNTFDPTIVSRLTNEASATIWNRYAQETSYVNMFAFLGELRSTVHMLRHPAETLAKLIETYVANVTINKVRFSKRRQHLDRIRPRTNRHVARKRRMIEKLLREERTVATKMWLQFQFGVKPLAGDIAKAAGAIFDYSRGMSFPDLKSIRASKFCDGEHSAELEQKTTEHNWLLSRQNSYTRGAKVKLIMTYDVRKDFQANTPLELLKSRFSFGFAQLVPALWDLAPLTVFTDYFVNINDVLTASATVTPKVIRSDKYVFEHVDASLKLWKRGNVQGGFVDMTQPSGTLAETTVSQVRYTRGVWDGAIPALSFTTPISSPVKLVNLLAFVNNVIK